MGICPQASQRLFNRGASGSKCLAREFILAFTLPPLSTPSAVLHLGSNGRHNYPSRCFVNSRSPVRIRSSAPVHLNLGDRTQARHPRYVSPQDVACL